MPDGGGAADRMQRTVETENYPLPACFRPARDPLSRTGALTDSVGRTGLGINCAKANQNELNQINDGFDSTVYLAGAHAAYICQSAVFLSV